MIPRYQRIVYFSLIGGILLLGALLLRGCERNHDRIEAMRDQSPIAAPADLPSEQVSIARASDADDAISLETISLPLPEDPSLRVRVLLDRTLADAAQPTSAHPLPAGPAISDVFLLALPIVTPNGAGASTSATSVGLWNGDHPQSGRAYEAPSSPYGSYHTMGDQLAVINLTKSFADAHPAGVEAEDLTLRMLIATLHAALPQVTEVRFLVDGQTRPTLAGHADLTRPYAVQDPAKLIHVLSPDGNPL